jgi:SAM-dependent methyltransferase
VPDPQRLLVTAISPAARVQRRLWGTDPQAWADLAEAHNRPLFEAVLGAVTGVNAFQFAGDPRRALAEAARVLRPGGRLVASLFAAPGRSEGTAAHEAMSALIPAASAGDHAPYALSAPGHLEQALTSVGLRITGDGEAVCDWRYASMDDAVRGLLCSAGGARAAEAAGPQAVRDALEPVLARFRDPASGAVTMRNTFRWVAAELPG